MHRDSGGALHIDQIPFYPWMRININQLLFVVLQTNNRNEYFSVIVRHKWGGKGQNLTSFLCYQVWVFGKKAE